MVIEKRQARILDFFPESYYGRKIGLDSLRVIDWILSVSLTYYVRLYLENGILGDDFYA